MIQLNCIAIDDELLALKKIKRYVDKIPYLNLIGSFEKAMDSILFLKENKVHLIFLDIEMDEMNGIEFLESIQNTPYIVITSAYKSYALKSFEFNVIDYLLKPIELNRFVKAVEKVCVNFQKDLLIDKNNVKANPNEDVRHTTSLFLKDGRTTHKVYTKDILYIEGMKDYLRVYTQNKTFMILSSFDTILEKLPKDGFLRVHKSYITSLDKIDFVDKNTIGIGQKIIPIGISYKVEFFKHYNLMKD